MPILEEYYAWLKAIHTEKGSKLGEAVRYSLNQKQQLCAFLDNGEVPISNNLAENAIRPFTLGRKNWLFCDTPKGAEASAVVYSMVESAKANGVEPFAYLQRALVELPYLGKSPPMKNWRPLCPGHPTSKRIVKAQIPMLIQIHILSNSRPWVWGLLFLGERGIIERLPCFYRRSHRR